MTRPHMVVIAGPNGAGKSALYDTVVAHWLPELPFVNADEIAAGRWPGDEARRAYEAGRLAAGWRAELIEQHASFVTETVFSHPSKVALIEAAREAGYEVWLLFVYVDAELAVRRVRYRVAGGGHVVPEDKIRSRHERLFHQVARALRIVDRAILFDNRRAAAGHEAVAVISAGQIQWKARPEWAVRLVGEAGLKSGGDE